MTLAHDYLLDSDGDLIIRQGDFATGFSEGQHITHILEAYTGWYRESALTGLGIQDYLKSAGAGPELKRSAQIQLEADNLRVTDITITGELELAVNAERIR